MIGYEGLILAPCRVDLRDRTVRLRDPATGAIIQTRSVEGVISYLKFARDGSCLISNLGSLDIQLGRDNVEIFIEQGQRVKLKGKTILWLPSEYRPRCSAIHSDLLALGHASGRVSFISCRV